MEEPSVIVLIPIPPSQKTKTKTKTAAQQNTDRVKSRTRRLQTCDPQPSSASQPITAREKQKQKQKRALAGLPINNSPRRSPSKTLHPSAQKRLREANADWWNSSTTGRVPFGKEIESLPEKRSKKARK